jgi:hypothetical protein
MEAQSPFVSGQVAGKDVPGTSPTE